MTFVTHLVLRRYIPREDWGLYDWAEVVFLVLGALRDLGLPAHAVRMKERPFGNVLRLELVWGAMLSGLVFIAAPLLLFALEDPHPQAVAVLRAMTLFLFLEGLAQVPLVYLESELDVGRAVAPELVRNVCFAATAVVLALGGHGVWSIVWAQIAASAVFAGLLWWRARGRMRLTLLAGRTPALLRASLRLALIWLLILMVRYIDRLILGARFPVEDLATYSFAYWAAFIVPMIMLQPIGRVAYPAFVAYAEDRPRRLGAYRLATLFLLAMEVPAALFLFVNAQVVLELIGGPQWVGAAAYLQVLCFAPLVDPFSRFGGELLASRHRDRTWILATAATMVSFLGFGLLLTGWMGPMGMAYANFLPLGALIMIGAVRGLGRSEFRRLAGDLLRIYLLPLPWFAATYLAFEETSFLRPLASAVALAITAVLYWRRFGEDFREFFRTARQV